MINMMDMIDSSVITILGAAIGFAMAFASIRTTVQCLEKKVEKLSDVTFSIEKKLISETKTNVCSLASLKDKVENIENTLDSFPLKDNIELRLETLENESKSL